MGRRLRSSGPENLGSPSVSQEPNDASEQTREQHNHANSKSQALLRDKQEAYYRADEEDSTEKY
jgi:hypothetical protein